jgi:hypothetical protein
MLILFPPFKATSKAGLSFSVPYLYDGLTFAGQPDFVDCADRLDNSCAGLRTCVVDGTTHADTVAKIIPSATINKLPSQVDAFRSFILAFDEPNRGCNVLAGGQFGVAEVAVRRHSTFSQKFKAGFNLHSREPLALVTRDGDPIWSSGSCKRSWLQKIKAKLLIHELLLLITIPLLTLRLYHISVVSRHRFSRMSFLRLATMDKCVGSSSE